MANTGFGNQGFVPNTQYNPNLKAETVTGVEFGLDAKNVQEQGKIERHLLRSEK